ncbi:MAG: sodium:solute symporter [Deltaproteobacteria bacterium]|nr:sodium:solute symporter [Deltaproteobacteria bacterium]
MNIGALDLGILLAYLAGVAIFGVWVGRGARSATDYMLGGRNLPWWVILFSIVATETSTVTFLSIPGFAFERNLTWLQLPLGFLIGRFVVAFLLLPHYFKGTLFTSYEVLHRRFGSATSRAASALFILTRSLADGLRLFLSAIVLQEMTGLDLSWSVLAVGVTTILYTFLGGMRAVLWTDMVQFFIYMAGGVLALGLILRRLPEGWSQMISLGEVAGRLQILDLTLNPAEPYALWAGLVGGIFVTLGSHGVDQLMVQRYLCARGLGDARRALGVSGFVVVGQFALFLIIGVALYAFYQVFPPAVAFERADRVFAHFIVKEVPVGLLGLLLGAVFAAAMSTLSSSLNSCATAAVKDFYLPWKKGEVSPRRQLRITRGFTIAFGLVQIAVGIGGQWVTSSVVSSVLGIASFTTGIVLGVFFLGMWAPRVGQRAALVGLLVGLAAMTWVKFATPLAWPWFALVGSVLTFAAGWGASLLWPARRGQEVEPR